MARSVAASIWRDLFSADPLNGDAGLRYRRDCLAHGGGRPSPEIVSDLLGPGRGEDVGRMADAVVAEVDDAAAQVRSLRR